jgi:hypothetical protein
VLGEISLGVELHSFTIGSVENAEAVRVNIDHGGHDYENENAKIVLNPQFSFFGAKSVLIGNPLAPPGSPPLGSTT